MTTAEDDIPRPKPQQERRRRFRYRGQDYRGQDPKRGHLKPDAAPADITFIRILRHTLSRPNSKSRLAPWFAWQDLVEYLIAAPPDNPTLLDKVEYCHAHLDSFTPRSQDFIVNMMDCARCGRHISDKQHDYILDLYEKLVRKRR